MDTRAEEIAKSIRADILVYGTIDASNPTWEITPKFYINPDYAFSDASELTGQDQLGSPQRVGPHSISMNIKDLNERTIPRGRLLSTVIAGMTWYLFYDYPRALDLFQSGESLAEDWGDLSGQKLLYLMIGNTYGKLYELNRQDSDLIHAKQSYEKALEGDPNYARANAGLGSVAYQQAQILSNQTGNPGDVDLKLLEESLKKYQQADGQILEPDLANLHTKIHLYQGQVSLAKALGIFYSQSGDESDALQYALDQFDQVLLDYQENPTPDMGWLAAEAHAYLGLIDRQMGDLQSSAVQYRQAIDLTDVNDPNRRPLFQKIYQDILDEMASATAAP
jgi:tetratricopeptide (TPR) repeat protein